MEPTTREELAKAYRSTMAVRTGTLPERYDKRTVDSFWFATNNNCNLSCAMCRKGLAAVATEIMDPAVFERALLALIRQVGRRSIVFSPLIGDPLMNPFLEDYLQILQRHELRILDLFTNGLLLEARLDVFARHPGVVRRLTLSIDGATAEVYERLRSPGKFNRLLRNLDALKDATAARPLFERIRVYTIVSDATAPSLAQVVDLFGAYVPRDEIYLCPIQGSNPDNTFFEEHSIFKRHIVPTRPCSDIVSPVAIRVQPNGDINCCARDYRNEQPFGNILEGDLDDMMNSEALLRLRRAHLAEGPTGDARCDGCRTMDPRLQSLFYFFMRALLVTHGARWEVPAMQQRFDRFFEAFAEGIPSEAVYLSLLS